MDEWTTIRTLTRLMLEPPLSDQPIKTVGDLGSALEAAYRAKRYRPAPPEPSVPLPRAYDRTDRT